MTPQELQQLIAKLQSKLARQKAALAKTNDEADLIDHGSGIPEPTKQHLLEQLSARQLRQHNAVQATEAYLKVLQSTTGVKTATK